MALDKLIELCIRQFGFDAADQHGGEFVADLWHQYGDAIRPLALQILGKQIGTILKFLEGFPN